jgi:hypothetical protein
MPGRSGTGTCPLAPGIGDQTLSYARRGGDRPVDVGRVHRDTVGQLLPVPGLIVSSRRRRLDEVPSM